MRFLMLPLVLMTSMIQTDEWSPPKNPDPSTILNEASKDARAKEYETALAKHVWYHENALSIQPSQYGVRLSFALASWAKLGEEYPPALKKLKEIRDAAVADVTEGEDVRTKFHDMESINDRLEEHSKTVEAFKTLEQTQPKNAKLVFDLAREALVLGKEYEICGKYISFEDALSNIVQSYERGKKWVEESDSSWKSNHSNYVKNKFTSDATLMVAILAVTGRKDEAKDFAEAVRTELDDEDFHRDLEESLKGVVPKPWP